jgi:hypothetical protein
MDMSRGQKPDQDLAEKIETSLGNALDERSPTEKDYHVRSALQDLILLKQEARRKENPP